jgi:serine/threonine-protein kinase
MDPASLGSYRLSERIAEDATTLTWRARRDRDPAVLVKAARPGLTNRAAVARSLQREAELLGSLGHRGWPTVVELFGDGGEAALVVTDTGGHRLSRVLERSGSLAPTVAMAIALEVASALGALHRLDLAHGALHTGLIEVTTQGLVCLHDPLGAAALPTELADPAHMSPEQILGDPPTARSDVFLLGAVLYAMLTGRGPFVGDGDGVSQRIRHHAPTPPSRVNPRVPRRLERLVLECLAKRQHERPPDITTVASRLSRELRRETSLPNDVLVSRALEAAGLADPLPAPADASVARGTALRLNLGVPGVVAIGLGVGLALALGLWWRDGDARGGDAAAGPRGIVDEPGRVRVLARPWAEVFVDGRRIDVTPMASPVEVKPGRHIVSFRHPAAPEEARTVELIAGQTVVVEVDMKVEATPHGSASPASSAAPRSTASAPPRAAPSTER